jgi:hypothetical protein
MTDTVTATTSRIAAPVRAAGGFFAMCLDTLVLMFRPPWAWLEQEVTNLLVPKYNLTASTLLSYRAHTQVTLVTAHHAAAIPQQRAMSE